MLHNIKKLVAIAILAIFVGPPSLLWASATQNGAGATAEVTAITEFNAAIAKYMAMRRGLASEVTGPVKDSSSSQVTNASDALAGAIQRARRDAHVGSIFNAHVAALITHRIADAVRDEKLMPVLAQVDDDGVAGPSPKVHLRLPVLAQMATMPASLLSVLPPLPKELEYRILGRYLVLRDIDASLVIDYIPAAVPR
jgi:hypothetical protein